MKPVAVFPVCDRLHYVRPALESWRGVRGIEDAYLVYRLEPGFPDMEDLVRRERPKADGEVIVNEWRLGNDTNMRAAVETGFATGADFVIAAEDDVLVAADLLEYMTAMAERYAADQSVLAVTSWQHLPPGPLYQVQRVQCFFGGTCWGFWRDRWEQVKDGWPPSGVGYDGYLYQACLETGRVCIQPRATRCKNIGEIGVGTTADFSAIWATQQFTADVPYQPSYEERPGVCDVFGDRIQ
jgi:hypothetical protein